MALSVLHLEQGELPSHFDFFRRHLSQALPTRFLMLSTDSEEEVLCGVDIFMVVQKEAPRKGKGVQKLSFEKGSLEANIGLCLMYSERRIACVRHKSAKQTVEDMCTYICSSKQMFEFGGL